MKILVVEGCSEEVLRENEASGLPFSCNIYADSLLLNAPTAKIEFAYPYSPARDRMSSPLEAFDGFALTGSSVAWGAESRGALPYMAFLEKVLATGKPVLGSCWGMQTVAVLLGGMSGPNPKGSEIGIARRITLTEAGKHHPLFTGMPDCFDSPAFHRDHVTRLPDGAVLLAGNAVSEVQAMACQTGEIDYMGFQFHPEVPLEHFRREHQTREPLPGTIVELNDFPTDVPEEISDALRRTKPLANWLNHVEAQRKLRASAA